MNKPLLDDPKNIQEEIIQVAPHIHSIQDRVFNEIGRDFLL